MKRNKRICLYCNKPFSSAGPHNRICGQCDINQTRKRIGIKMAKGFSAQRRKGFYPQ